MLLEIRREFIAKAADMLFLEIVFEALAQTLGGMLATAAIVFLTWTPFKVIGRPEWGPALAFLILTFVYVEKVTTSPLLPMTLIMLMPTALGAWWEGYEWRRRQKLKKLFKIILLPSKAPHCTNYRGGGQSEHSCRQRPNLDGRSYILLSHF